MTEANQRLPLLRLLICGMFASPAVAVVEATRVWPARRARWAIRIVTATLTLLVAALLFLRPMRWPVAAVIWAAFCLLGCGVALVVAFRGRWPAAEASRGGWGRQFLQAAVPLTVAVISLQLVCWLIGWAVMGELLARFSPEPKDLGESMSSLFIDSLWAVPAMWIFAALALRRGRLDSGVAWLRAVAAWTVFLVLLELIMLATFGVLRTQLIAVAGFDDGGTQMWVIRLLLGLSSVAFTSLLAWGPGSWPRRLVATVVAMLLAVLSLGILTGGTGRVQLAVGRVLDRQGEIEASLTWYGRALVAGGGAPLRSYLQHRIGILQYRRGNLEQAATAFRLVSSTHDANSTLVRESNYFLERLAVAGNSEEAVAGRRVALDGVGVTTQRRAAYCAPNTMALVANHWGVGLDVDTIGEQVAAIGGGTHASAMRFLFADLGLEMYLYPLASFDDVRWLIDHGLPAMLFLPGHVMAVYGYDDLLGTAVTYDTATWDLWAEQPYPDLLSPWSNMFFLLGVVVPRDDSSPAVVAARDRFGGARAAAAWQWSLYREEPSGTDRELAYLERGIVEDPTLLLNSFYLLEHTGLTPWIEQHADYAAVTDQARAMPDRPFGSKSLFFRGLASWHFDAGRYQDVLAVAEDLQRREGRVAEVSSLAGRAAAKLGRWQETTYYLTEEIAKVDEYGEETQLGPRAHAALVRAYHQLGDHDRVVAELPTLVSASQGKALIEAVKLAETLAVDRNKGFLEDVYFYYLAKRPDDAERQLRFAKLMQHSERSVENRPHRLQLARRAVALARALTDDADLRLRSELLAAEIDQERAALRLDL